MFVRFVHTRRLPPAPVLIIFIFTTCACVNYFTAHNNPTQAYPGRVRVGYRAASMFLPTQAHPGRVRVGYRAASMFLPTQAHPGRVRVGYRAASMFLGVCGNIRACVNLSD